MTSFTGQTATLYKTAFDLGQKYAKAETRTNTARDKALTAAIEFVHSVPESERGSDDVTAALAAITEGMNQDTRNHFNRAAKDARIHKIVDDNGGDVSKALKAIKADAPKAADYLGACRKITAKRKDGKSTKTKVAVEISPDGQEQAKMLKTWYASKRPDLSESDVNVAVANAVVQLEKLNTAPVKEKSDGAELPAVNLGNQSDANTGTNG
mgnify:CR=1 FL=1